MRCVGEANLGSFEAEDRTDLSQKRIVVDYFTSNLLVKSK